MTCSNAGADLGAAAAGAHAARGVVVAAGGASAELEAKVVGVKARAVVPAATLALTRHVRLPQGLLVRRAPLDHLRKPCEPS